MQHKNTVFEEIYQYMNEHDRKFDFSTELGKKYNEEMDAIRKFDGKRVKIKYFYISHSLIENGFISGILKVADLDGKCYDAEAEGKINLDGKYIRFFKGKKRKYFYLMDAGAKFFEYGNMITNRIPIIMPMEIETI